MPVPPSGPGSLIGNPAPWNISLYTIISDAMMDAGLAGEGDEVNPEELANSMRRINKIVNYLQTRGLKLWTQIDLAVPLIAGQSQYSLSTIFNQNGLYPKRVLQGYYLDTTGNRRPLTAMSWQEWLMMSNITTQGAVTQYFVDKQILDTVVTFWLTPSSTEVANGAVHLLTQGQIQNFTAVSNQSTTPNFPPEWALCLEWMLAAQICTGQPQKIVDRCEINAAKYQEELENWDVEDASTTFQPDPRGQYSGRRFRY